MRVPRALECSSSCSELSEISIRSSPPETCSVALRCAFLLDNLDHILEGESFEAFVNKCNGVNPDGQLVHKKAGLKGLKMDLSNTATGPNEEQLSDSSTPRYTLCNDAGAFLLYKSDVRRRPALGHFLDRTELRFVAPDVFAECAPDPLGMPRADDHALEQLALRSVGENINKIQRELFQIVVNHHQIAVLALQLFLVRFDLHLPLRWPLFFHLLLPLSSIS